MRRLMTAVAALAALSGAVVAAPVKRAFAPVPKQALVELKATVGKPFSSGLVFVNGRFLPPPYKVERFGTALRINGVQVTGQIIDWDEFLKTQVGARVEKVESSESDAPKAEPEESASAPTPAPPKAASSDPFDDLFSDDSASDAAASKPASAVEKSESSAPAPTPPSAATKVVFEGTFRPNDRTRTMVERLNKGRARVESTLRKGGAYFFGERYSAVAADRGPTDMFLSVIPQVMKDSSSFEGFSSSARAKGIGFLSEAVMRDLFRNRLDYPRLQERARKVKEERQWETMLNGMK